MKHDEGQNKHERASNECPNGIESDVMVRQKNYDQDELIEQSKTIKDLKRYFADISTIHQPGDLIWKLKEMAHI